MVLLNDQKYACDSCIKGHRVSSCRHHERALRPIAPKGRPPKQCENCRRARNSRSHLAKCDCADRKDKHDSPQISSSSPSDHILSSTKKRLRTCWCQRGENCSCGRKSISGPPGLVRPKTTPKPRAKSSENIHHDFIFTPISPAAMLEPCGPAADSVSNHSSRSASIVPLTGSTCTQIPHSCSSSSASSSSEPNQLVPQGLEFLNPMSYIPPSNLESGYMTPLPTPQQSSFPQESRSESVSSVSAGISPQKISSTASEHLSWPKKPAQAAPISYKAFPPLPADNSAAAKNNQHPQSSPAADSFQDLSNWYRPQYQTGFSPYQAPVPSSSFTPSILIQTPVSRSAVPSEPGSRLFPLPDSANRLVSSLSISTVPGIIQSSQSSFGDPSKSSPECLSVSTCAYHPPVLQTHIGASFGFSLPHLSIQLDPSHNNQPVSLQPLSGSDIFANNTTIPSSIGPNHCPPPVSETMSDCSNSSPSDSSDLRLSPQHHLPWKNSTHVWSVTNDSPNNASSQWKDTSAPVIAASLVGLHAIPFNRFVPCENKAKKAFDLSPSSDEQITSTSDNEDMSRINLVHQNVLLSPATTELDSQAYKTTVSMSNSLNYNATIQPSLNYPHSISPSTDSLWQAFSDFDSQYAMTNKPSYSSFSSSLSAPPAPSMHDPDFFPAICLD